MSPSKGSNQVNGRSRKIDNLDIVYSGWLVYSRERVNQ